VSRRFALTTERVRIALITLGFRPVEWTSGEPVCGQSNGGHLIQHKIKTRLTPFLLKGALFSSCVLPLQAKAVSYKAVLALFCLKL